MVRKKKIKKKLKKNKSKNKSKAAPEAANRYTPYKSKALKNNEVKIKKIIKQPTEKRIYNIKDYVVYPKHGIGKIISIDKAKIGEIDINFYKVFI